MSDKKKKSSAKAQSDFIRFMILTGLGGLFILVLTLFIVASTMTKKNTKIKEEEAPAEDKTPVESKATGEMEEVIGVVLKDAGNDSITILNVENEKQIVLQIENGVEMKDIYGQSMSLREFKVGDMIETKYDKGSMVPKYLRITGEAWEQDRLKNIKINLEGKTIEIGNNIYTYTNNLISMYKGEPISLDQIDSIDELTLRGYKNYVWFIDVKASHGYINVTASQDEEGMVEVDNGMSVSIKEAKNIAVTEGAHKVVIKKEGYEPIVKNVQVDAMQTVNIDLGEMQKKVGKLKVVAKGVSDYKVFINNVEYPGNETILLEYGDYHLVVKKEGYKDWNKDFKMNEESIRIDVDLQKEEVPQLVKVSIDTNPTGAEVYIDDSFMGISPMETQLPYGEHKISLIKDGYSPLHIPISLGETQKQRSFLFTLQEAANE
ncbi:MAG: PEGA domain-containing protein [Epulopiscium sp.]|nr:PEGA domain-containing protein [Candidatus Epulonipiscium sp.]